jgi:NAD(P)-dependent dehydrogenase (short-subunit alcohol dehydrogenase family)
MSLWSRFSMAGRTVLLTGGLGTLGRVQAATMAEALANVVLLDVRGQDEGEAFAATIPGARYVTCDLNEIAAARVQVADLSAEVGGIDILVNNAALILNAPFETVALDDYERQVRINSSAAFALAQAVAPDMKAKGYGKIINFCSVTLNGEWMGFAPYVASKGALLGLTKALARELGPHGIRVNAISPGAIVSEAEARVFGDRLEAYNDWILERQSLKTRLVAQHIADTVVFLASSASDGMSGSNVEVSGGW